MLSEKIKNRILPSVFLLFICSLAILFVFLPKKSFSESEKRSLADFPVASLDTVKNGKFTDDFEKYMSDHFPFRDGLVSIDSYFGVAMGQVCNGGVYVGSDGYLITEPVEFDGEKLAKNAAYIEKFIKKTNLKSYVILIPQAGYIMDEKLPFGHKTYKDDEIFGSVAENAPSAKFIDVREALKTEKKASQVYFKTDHHLTGQGAMTVYGEFCKNTGHEIKYFYLSDTVGGFYGTTYYKSGLKLTPADTVEVYKCASKNAYSVTVDDGTETKTSDSLYFNEHLNEKDKYPLFLDGNHAFVRIQNRNVSNGKKLLLIKDSYAHIFATYAIENYEEIVMIDLRYYKKSLNELIKSEQFTEALFMFGTENISTSTDFAWMLM